MSAWPALRGYNPTSDVQLLAVSSWTDSSGPSGKVPGAAYRLAQQPMGMVEPAWVLQGNSHLFAYLDRYNYCKLPCLQNELVVERAVRQI